MMFVHPEANRCIMNANSDGYSTYEAPFNKAADGGRGDIDWEKLADEKKYDEDGERAGIFMNAVCRSFYWNCDNDYDMNFAAIQDEMRDNANGAVPIKGDFKTKIGIEIDESGNLRNSVKLRMRFKRNETKFDWYMTPNGDVNFQCL